MLRTFPSTYNFSLSFFAKNGNFIARFHFDQVNSGWITPTLCGKIHFSISDGTNTTNCVGLCHKCHTGTEFYKVWPNYDEQWSIYRQRLLSCQQMFVEWHHMVRGMWRWVTIFSPICSTNFSQFLLVQNMFLPAEKEIISNIR